MNRIGSVIRVNPSFFTSFLSHFFKFISFFFFSNSLLLSTLAANNSHHRRRFSAAVRRRPPSSGEFPAMQVYHQDRLIVLFLLLWLFFRNGKPIFTKMTRDSSASSPSISESDRQIIVILRYVGLMATIYNLNGGDRRWSLQSPKTAIADSLFIGEGYG